MFFVFTMAFTAVVAVLCVGGWIASVARHKPFRFLPPRTNQVFTPWVSRR